MPHILYIFIYNNIENVYKLKKYIYTFYIRTSHVQFLSFTKLRETYINTIAFSINYLYSILALIFL